MSKRIERIKQWLEKQFAEDEVEMETQKIAFDIMADKLISWIFSHFLPILIIAFAIDLIIMFAIPLEIAMSRWFWVKEPLSIGVAYIICLFFRWICRQLKHLDLTL